MGFGSKFKKFKKAVSFFSNKSSVSKLGLMGVAGNQLSADKASQEAFVDRKTLSASSVVTKSEGFKKELARRSDFLKNRESISKADGKTFLTRSTVDKEEAIKNKRKKQQGFLSSVETQKAKRSIFDG